MGWALEIFNREGIPFLAGTAHNHGNRRMWNFEDVVNGSFSLAAIMDVGVDQSGKVNLTEHHTAVVFCPLDAGEPRHSVFVPRKVTAQVHQRIKPEFKRQKRRSWLGPKMFVVSLYYLLRDHVQDVDTVLVEDEYPGNMHEVVNAVCSMIEADRDITLERRRFEVQPRVFNFEAHHLANDVRKRNTEPDMEIQFRHFRRKMM